MSLITALSDALDGNFVPDEIAAQRRQICHKCAFNRGIGTCIRCGCFISLKVKMPRESCPIKKWQEANESKES